MVLGIFFRLDSLFFTESSGFHLDRKKMDLGLHVCLHPWMYLQVLIWYLSM